MFTLYFTITGLLLGAFVLSERIPNWDIINFIIISRYSLLLLPLNHLISLLVNSHSLYTKQILPAIIAIFVASKCWLSFLFRSTLLFSRVPRYLFIWFLLMFLLLLLYYVLCNAAWLSDFFLAFLLKNSINVLYWESIFISLNY